MKLFGIKVTIKRFTAEWQPGWIQCSFIDTHGKLPIFNEEVPVVSDKDWDADSEYPCFGIIGCQVVGSYALPDGIEPLIVDALHPGACNPKQMRPVGDIS